MPSFGDSRDMACTRADIARWLTEITGEPAASDAQGALRVPCGAFDLRISVDPLPPKRLGLVTFRLSRVVFSYPPEHQDAARAFIRRFDHHTQRGGG